MSNKRKFIIFGGIFSVILLIAAIYVNQTSLTLVSTTPAINATTHQHAAVTFTYNQPLAAPGSSTNQLSVSPSVNGNVSVSGNSITFTPFAAYNDGGKYTVTLKSVRSTSGKTAGNASITFTVKAVDYNQLPTDVQQRLLKQTDADEQVGPYLPSSIIMSGSPTLSEHGISETQLSALQTAFFDYFATHKQEVRVVSLINIVSVPHSRTVPKDHFTFDVQVDGKTIARAKMEYGLVRIRLFLYNPATGAQIYDSDSSSSSATD